MKTCTRCREAKDLDLFPRQKGTTDGRHSHCKECKSRYDALRYDPKGRQQKYLDNLDQERKARRDYYQLNKEDYFVRKANRRAAELKTVPRWYEEFDDLVLLEMRDLAKRYEALTGMKWEVDHNVPLMSPKVCGLHWHKNWQLIPQWENRSKGNKF